MLALSAQTRARNLARMAEERLDVLVVGGGITGAGVALDAAARGLRVGLVERRDFAAGTSGRSSRLVHGGVRYLRHGDLRVVYEGLRERAILLRIAPHLVRPFPFFVPRRRLSGRVALGSALLLYDALALHRNIAGHRWVGEREAARLAPGLVSPSGGYVYWDGRADDARLTIEVVRQAAALGAVVANAAEVEAPLGDGRVAGALVHDGVTGRRFEVRARVVVNATGAWADRLLGGVASAAPRLRPSKGAHLVFDRDRVRVRSAVLVPSIAGDGGFVFAVPSGPRVFAGTTDTPYAGPLDDPPVDPDDVAVVLASVARALAPDLTEGDVLASWAGVRPLLDVGRKVTRDISRRHVTMEGPPGMLTITGGKLTAFRSMAEGVVDRACRILGCGGPCRTRTLPIGLTRPLPSELERAAAAARAAGLRPEEGRRLVGRYGDDWEAAMGLIRDHPALAEEAVPGLPVLRVELLLARTREMALTGEDVLVRRTRLATMDAAAAEALQDLPLPTG